MGKWTPNHVDDVLHAKISSLVSGAIRRASVEKEPSITYEHFVNELDTGDSFTTSIIDLLVKEVADRRTRANLNDRKLLSDRTIKTLRQLSSQPRSYPTRIPGRSHGRSSRAQHLTEYFTSLPNELEMDDEDDDFGDPLTENPTTIEGARVNSDLYDAFATSPWPPPVTRRITASPSPVSDEWPLPPPRSPPSSSRPWSTVVPTSVSVSAPTNLSRQASIRRAARSRMVDFNDFTHRRRTTTRDTLATRLEGGGAETVTEPRESISSQSVRRFFPFPRPARRHQSTSANQAWSSEFSDTLSPDSDDPVQYFSIEPAVAAWYDHTTGEPRDSPDAESREETENLLRAPRLRRGAVRAPESMLSRHASPITINTPPTEDIIPAFIARREESTSTPANEEPVAYPTPGSTENENLA